MQNMQNIKTRTTSSLSVKPRERCLHFIQTEKNRTPKTESLTTTLQIPRGRTIDSYMQPIRLSLRHTRRQLRQEWRRCKQSHKCNQNSLINIIVGEQQSPPATTDFSFGPPTLPMMASAGRFADSPSRLRSIAAWFASSVVN